MGRRVPLPASYSVTSRRNRAATSVFGAIAVTTTTDDAGAVNVAELRSSGSTDVTDAPAPLPSITRIKNRCSTPALQSTWQGWTTVPPLSMLPPNKGIWKWFERLLVPVRLLTKQRQILGYNPAL